MECSSVLQHNHDIPMSLFPLHDHPPPPLKSLPFPRHSSFSPVFYSEVRRVLFHFFVVILSHGFRRFSSLPSSSSFSISQHNEHLELKSVLQSNSVSMDDSWRGLALISSSGFLFYFSPSSFPSNSSRKTIFILSLFVSLFVLQLCIRPFSISWSSMGKE